MNDALKQLAAEMIAEMTDRLIEGQEIIREIKKDLKEVEQEFFSGTYHYDDFWDLFEEAVKGSLSPGMGFHISAMYRSEAKGGFDVELVSDGAAVMGSVNILDVLHDMQTMHDALDEKQLDELIEKLRETLDLFVFVRKAEEPGQ